MGDFGKILKGLRMGHNVSQQELAAKIEISKSAVSMYEQGNREPDFDVLGRIADYFQVEIDYLLGRGEHAPDSDYPVTIAAHLDTSDLTQAELNDVANYIEFIRTRRSPK